MTEARPKVIYATRAKRHVVELDHHEVREAIKKAVDAPIEARVYFDEGYSDEPKACVVWETDHTDISDEVEASYDK